MHMNARPCVRNRRQEPTRVYKDYTMKYTSSVCLQNDWPVLRQWRTFTFTNLILFQIFLKQLMLINDTYKINQK